MSADDGCNCDPNGRTRAGCLDSKETHITLAIRPNSDRKTGGAASPQSSEIETKRGTGFDLRLSVLSSTSKAPGGDDGSRDSENNGCLLSLEQGNSTSYPGNSIPRSLSQYSQDETDKRSHNHLDCNDPGKLACDPILEVSGEDKDEKDKEEKEKEDGDHKDDGPHSAKRWKLSTALRNDSVRKRLFKEPRQRSWRRHIGGKLAFSKRYIS